MWRDDEQQRAPYRRAHVTGGGDHAAAERADARARIGQAAGVAIDDDVIEAGAGRDHREAVRQLVQPGREQLERIEQHAAERQVPQQERREQRDRERAQLDARVFALLGGPHSAFA